MANRKSLADLETDTTGDGAQPAIPPGVDAKVRVEYTTKVDPNNERSRARAYNDELEALAESEADNLPEAPYDPLTEFVAEWRNYIGYSLRIVRLPDPAARRIPGHTYNRACFELEQLSDTPFDPTNITGTLQIINGNSGGVFRLWLVDEAGLPIPGARLDRVAVGDPPKQYGREREQRNDYDPRYAPAREPVPLPVLPIKSEMEQRMDNLQAQLFERAIMRAMDPPPAPVSVSGISDEDRVGLLLLNQGGLLPALMAKLTALAQSPESIAEKQSWQERGINALLHLAETNPAIVDRLSGTIERVVNRVLPDPRAPVNVAPNLQPTQPVPAQHSALSTQHLESEPLPEAPDPNEPLDEDQDIMDIVESLFTMLSDTRPFSVNDPVFTELRTAYPVKFRGAIQMIASVPLESVIDWIKTQGTLYEALLNGPITGPHYRARLAELQAFCRAPAPQYTVEITHDETQSTPITFDETTKPDNDETR